MGGKLASTEVDRINRKRPVYWLFVILHCVILVNTSHGQSLEWAKKIGGSSATSGTAVCADLQGNVYTVGLFSDTIDFDPGSGVFELTPDFFGQNDIFISKLDAAGDFVWAKKFSGNGNKFPEAVDLDSNGNLFLTGYFFNTVDFDPGADTFSLTSAGNADIFITKLDAEGNFVWSKQIGGNSNEVGHSIEVDLTGHVYLTGFFEGTVDFDSGESIASLNSIGASQDIFILKLNSIGGFEWVKQIGGSANDIGNCISTDSEGKVFLSGIFGTTVDFDPGEELYSLTSSGTVDAFVSKFEPSGAFVWARQLGGTGGEGEASLSLDSLGNVYCTGFFFETAYFDVSSGQSHAALLSSGGSDVYVVKFDHIGNFLWARSLGGPNDEIPYSIDVDALGNVYSTGLFAGTADFDPGNQTAFLTAQGANDAFVSVLDSQGNFISAKRIGGTGLVIGNSIAVDTNQNIYITGILSGIADFDPNENVFNLTSEIVNSGFVAKWTGPQLGVEATNLEDSISLYPNPSSGECSIELGKRYTTIEARILNSLGQEIGLFLFKNSKTIDLELEIGQGVYFVSILLDGKSTQTVRFLKK